MQQVDVLVIGMGPGGASAAAEAALAGRSVLCVERNRTLGEPVQCAEFIPNPLGRYARAAGVLQQRVTGMKTMLPSGAVEASEFPGLMIDRAAFDRSIAKRATDAGARVLTGTRLIGLDAQRRVATCEDKTQRFEVAYEVLVAGDGPHSPTAELLGLAPLEIVYTRQYTVPLLQPYEDTDIWLSDDYPGGYGWLFPKGAVANLGLGADREFEDNLKRPLEALHAALVAQGLLGAEILGRTGGAIPVGGPRAHLVVGRVLFVGDAAGLTHPITGAGIHAAVESGEAAGRAAAAYLAGDADAFGDFEEDVRDQFEPGLRRAVERRAALKNCWRTPAATQDRTMRRGWIAFDEYFAA